MFSLQGESFWEKIYEQEPKDVEKDCDTRWGCVDEGGWGGLGWSAIYMSGHFPLSWNYRPNKNRL